MLSFPEFFQELHQHQPFPWQARLAEEVRQGPWPHCLALPTASGKTSVIDIALHAMASCAERGEQPPYRRIFFVVDRRIIVDEAHLRARHIASRLERQSGALEPIAQALTSLAGGPQLSQLNPSAPPLQPVMTYALRGGTFRDLSWTTSPLQPLIICSTVDQIGSRLLFRGYGSSPKAHSHHAGLVSNDSLIFLDEAHCSEPFLQTVRNIQAYQRRSPNPRALQFVILSATPPKSIQTHPSRVFSLQLNQDDPSSDIRHPILGPRLSARKHAQLVSTKDTVKTLRDRALELRKQGHKAICVFVNRILTARRVYESLAKEIDASNLTLLTGRIRELDRQEVIATLEPLKTGSTADPSQKGLIVVATQTLEVGADLDFDAIVSECASLSALKQRFGRLDRSGRKATSPAFIVINEKDIQPKKPDPVYANAISECWKWLQSIAQDSAVDFGILALQAHPNPPSGVDLPPRDAPTMLPAYLDQLVQTNPPPAPEIDIAQFLHGPQTGLPDVYIALRANLLSKPLDFTRDQLAQFQAPAAAELLPVPLPTFKKWMNKQSETTDLGSDIEAFDPDDSADSAAENERWALRWRGRDDENTIVIQNASLSEVRPGDILVIPTALAERDFYLMPQPHPSWLLDRADEALDKSRGLLQLRISPTLINIWEQSWRSNQPKENADPPPLFNRLREQLAQLDEAALDDEGVVQTLFALIDTLTELLPDHLKRHADKLKPFAAEEDEKLVLSFTPANPLSEATLTVAARSHKFDATKDESDSDESRSLGAKEVTLADHCANVGRLAGFFARSLGLSDEMSQLLQIAGQAHDIGKADPRFQAWLRATVPNLPFPTLLAKSRAYRDAAQRSRGRATAQYPRGGRHELISAQALQDNPQLTAQCASPELLIHLVAAHHGYARPFPPYIHDSTTDLKTLPFSFQGALIQTSVHSQMHRLDSGQLERFWTLVREHGWWGLSFLEALLICADQSCSQWEKQQ